MFVTSPHCHFPIQYLHPVTGLIVLCNLQHHVSRLSLERAANDYISHVQDIQLKMVGQLSSQLEYVVAFNDSTGIPLHYWADNYFNSIALDSLMADYPVLVPFHITTDKEVIKVFQKSLEYISTSLSNLMA